MQKDKETRNFARITALMLVVILVTNGLGGCALDKTGMVRTSNNLMEGISVKAEITSQDIASWMENRDMQKSVNTFGVSMFKQSLGDAGGENLLVSPISVLYAMSMCANGAEGETKHEMLAALINGSYTGPLEDGMRETPGEGDIFDESARKEINKWIEDNTKGLIKDMLKEMDENAIMYLINALGFEAEWLSPYEDYQVQDETFHGENGDSTVPFMHSQEWGYLKDDLATGFIKPYAGWDYAFVGLLPNEGVSVDEYIASLTGEDLYKMLTEYSQEDVIVSIPQFENESAMSLVETFMKMGVKDAFNIDAADFTKLGTYEDRNIKIGDILHNTYIKVDQNGTKAGAATVVEMVAEGAFFEPEPPKEVHLDRPFVYMIIDANQNIPLFIGVERNI